MTIVDRANREAGVYRPINQNARVRLGYKSLPQCDNRLQHPAERAQKRTQTGVGSKKGFQVEGAQTGRVLGAHETPRHRLKATHQLCGEFLSNMERRITDGAKAVTHVLYRHLFVAPALGVQHFTSRLGK